MYAHDNHPLVGYTSTDFFGHFPLLDATGPLPNLLSPPPPVIPAGNEFDPVAAPLNSELGYSSSGCSSYGSPASYSAPMPSLTQRSVSSHSLNGFRQQVPTSPAEFLESETPSPVTVRRVFSNGDLQRINRVQHYQRSESPLTNENGRIIEGMSKAYRYSPEEKQERIERYRSKRNQRNFNKKIKYACRKTLADSRQRIRGRFARNEIEKSSQSQGSHMGLEEDDEDYDNWVSKFRLTTPSSSY